MTTFWLAFARGMAGGRKLGKNGKPEPIAPAGLRTPGSGLRVKESPARLIPAGLEEGFKVEGLIPPTRAPIESLQFAFSDIEGLRSGCIDATC